MDEDLETRIHDAIKADQPKCLAALLEELAQLNSQMAQTRCPLHLAVNFGSYRCLELLLKTGKIKDYESCPFFQHY